MELPDLTSIDIGQLPHSLQALIECIGLENAYQLTCAYGGRPKYIPKHRARTKLADVLPADALDALIKRFAGVALEIPKADHFLGNCAIANPERKRRRFVSQSARQQVWVEPATDWQHPAPGA